MPEIKDVPLRKLKLDLQNFRTVPQANEVDAIQAMVAISPNKFWGLMNSLVDSGYLPTENIITLRNNKDELIVREGNRRIASLKLIHGIIPTSPFDIPEDILSKIENIPSAWKRMNKAVPCAIYANSEAKTVDRIVTLTHGKGEKASRENWEAVARARHNRDMNGGSEPALDLLEKFLSEARNISKDQARRWAGDYPITVLDEAIKKSYKRFDAASARDLAKKYPSVKYRSKLDDILKDVGTYNLTFKKIRSNPDFLTTYGVPAPSDAKDDRQGKPDNDANSKGKGHSTNSPTEKNENGDKKPLAVSTNDPRSVRKALKAFSPAGDNREKVVALRDEAATLNLNANPIAFCFLLRSMFEISAKAYCHDHRSSPNLTYKKKDGRDKTLSDLLRDITKHLTKNETDIDMQKKLHGAMTELGRKEGLLSVTSMNQLVHNPAFTLVASDISSLFGNIFPLLQAMNE